MLVEWFPIAELQEERKAALRLRGLCHVHLLRLLDIGSADPRNAYAVSEAPDGVDLFTVLRAAPGELPPFWGVAVLRAVTSALCSVDNHLARGSRHKGGHGGHGRVNLGTIFVGWDGSVRLLAYSPLGLLGGSGRFEDNVALELRLSDRLLTSAADVYALGALLRELLPPAALRRKAVAHLLRRCLHPQLNLRIALSTLGDALEELLFELRAPIARAQAIGEVLGRYCPRATTDLIDADWGEHTGDGFPALPPTLAHLSASTVLLSPTWLRPLPPKKATPYALLRNLALPAALGIASIAALGAMSPSQKPVPPSPSVALAPAVNVEEPPSSEVPPPLLQGLRMTIERVERAPARITLLVRLKNGGTQPIAPELSALRLFLKDAPQATSAPLAPLAAAAITVGAGRAQDIRLHFPIEPSRLKSGRQLSLHDMRLSSLPLRDFASVPK